MLDRTPVLLRARRDFSRISEHTVRVSAIDAAQALERTEVLERVAVDHDEGAAVDPGHAVESEADRLVEGEAEVDEAIGTVIAEMNGAESVRR